jgi:hypothetical protein
MREAAKFRHSGVIPQRGQVVSEKHLRRYSDLPTLCSLLTNRKITLLDPQSWDDSNDSHFISVYKEKKKLRSVLALCFTQASETYHHWRAFAGNSSGICIEFKRAELLTCLANEGKETKGIITREVVYLTLSKIRAKIVKIDDLPFIKRWGFKDEMEFRIIYASPTEELSAFDIPISLSCVSKIYLSPWIHNSLDSPVRQMLKSIDGCGHLSVVRSTLIGNEEWKTIAGRSA